MNGYEARKQARIDHYREKAEEARTQSSALGKQASEMLSVIPPGQPLLIGHHSYQADKRYRERIGRKFEQSIAAGEKADYYEQKAQAAENNHAISSDDPEALTKLTEKLERLQSAQARMKRINAYYRKNGTCKGFPDLPDDRAAELDQQVEDGYSWEKSPYPAYILSNNNQEINRLKKRIQKLTEARELGYQGWEFEGGKVVANTDLNRLQVFFDDIPSGEIRQEMHRWGFHWTRSAGAWQRQLSDNAIYAAGRVAAIRPLDGSDPVKIQPKRKPKTTQHR